MTTLIVASLIAAAAALTVLLGIRQDGENQSDGD